jgi:hypothetical protein
MASSSNSKRSDIVKKIQWFKDGIIEGYINYLINTEFKNIKVIVCRVYQVQILSLYENFLKIINLIIKELINEVCKAMLYIINS